ncbi:hypothetical protein [Micromonospora sp. A200]|nr:hypothetical protein [Micromonospora sp. A200]
MFELDRADGVREQGAQRDHPAGAGEARLELLRLVTSLSTPPASGTGG